MGHHYFFWAAAYRPDESLPPTHAPTHDDGVSQRTRPHASMRRALACHRICLCKHMNRAPLEGVSEVVERDGVGSDVDDTGDRLEPV